jgi:WD40 repeat protein
VADSGPDTAERRAALEFNRLMGQSSLGTEGARQLREHPEREPFGPPVPNRLPPELEQRFRLVRELPAGGESDIFVVTDEAGRELVLKLYRIGVVPSPDAWAILHTVNSPHVARLVEWGDVDGRAFEVMENAGTATLADLIEAGSRDGIGTETIIDVVRQVADGLNALHSARVIHRDLKPGNILVWSQEPLQLVLADFGLSRYMEHSVAFSAAGHTLAYTAPETFAGHVSPARDWWSLGMIVREMATGKSPFLGLSTEVVMLTLAARPIDFLQVTNPRLRLLCRGLLVRDPVARWGAAEVAQWLADETPDLPEDAGARLPTDDDAPDAEVRRRQCPYPGLAPFGVDDADVFFGRDRLTAGLLEAVRNPPGRNGLIIAIGASGTGKSSLLRAGLLARLASGGLGPETQDWPRVLMTPGRAPLEELAISLATITGISADRLHEMLDTQSGKAALPLRRAIRAKYAQPGREQAPDATVRLTLVVDQFEEAFTLADEEQRTKFIDVLDGLAAAGRDTDGPSALVVLGLRADYYPECTRYPSLARALQDRQFVVTPMTEADIRLAIVAPAEQNGLTFEPGLVEQIVADVTGTGGQPPPGVLPFLSQAMLAIWQLRSGTTLTHQAYQASGGVAHGIQQNAEATYNRLTPGQRDATRTLFRRMITLGPDGRPVRRSLDLAELFRSGQDTLTAWNELTEARLVVAEKDATTIAHDALLGAWPRLREWLVEDEERIRLRAQLSQASRAWMEHGGDPGYLYRGTRLTEAITAGARDPDDLTAAERDFLAASRRLRRRQSRLRRSLITGLAALTLLACGAGILAQQQAKTANAQRLIALSEQVTAESQAISDPTTSALLAVAAWRISPTSQAASNLISAYTRVNVTTLGGQKGPVSSLSFSPDGKVLAVADDTGEVELWNTESKTPTLIRSLAGGSGSLTTQAVYNPHGSILATADSEGKVRLTNGATGQQIGPPLVVGTGLTNIAFSPDGKVLATASETDQITLWDVADVEIRAIRTLPGSTSASSVQFSPDGRLLGAVTSRGTVQLWDVASPTPAAAVSINAAGADSIAFSPDGQTLAVSEANGTVELWNIATTRQFGRLQAGSGSTTAAFSPNGEILATASTNGTVRLWNTTTLRQIGAPLTANGISDAAFSPDGQTLATASVGSTPAIQLWALPTTTSTSQIIADICAKTGNDLTRAQWTQYVSGVPYEPACPA